MVLFIFYFISLFISIRRHSQIQPVDVLMSLQIKSGISVSLYKENSCGRKYLHALSCSSIILTPAFLGS